MTKKDYEIIANTFKKEFDFTAYLYMHENELIIARQERGEKINLQRRRELYIELSKADRVVRSMANALKDQNPKFNYSKFLSLCGMEESQNGVYSYRARTRK